jgi:hypothetical protein
MSHVVEYLDGALECFIQRVQSAFAHRSIRLQDPGEADGGEVHQAIMR